jgi:shikimate dehydrogenase
MPLQFFIIGDPISHSISPCIHNTLFEHYSLDARYDAIRVRGIELDAFFRKLRDTYRGGNVTVPHKVASIPFMDDLGEEAKYSGAINTVTLQDDGRLRGNNTDSTGFVYSLKEELGGKIPEPVAIIGAGGAARGILYGLIAAGLKKYLLFNRTLSRAEEVIGHMSSLSGGVDISIHMLEVDTLGRSLAGAGLIVNASSLGLVENFKDFPFGRLKMETTIVDIVYKKGGTSLMKEGLKRGFRCVGALPMLAAQAAYSFHHWTGIMPDYNLVKNIASKCLENT